MRFRDTAVEWCDSARLVWLDRLERKLIALPSSTIGRLLAAALTITTGIRAPRSAHLRPIGTAPGRLLIPEHHRRIIEAVDSYEAVSMGT